MGGPLATVETVTVPVESFTDEERARLAPHFTNLDRPVFGLVNLPETVKGALFARYSRYPGTLRRLFLDEFADSVPEVPAIEGSEGERAAALYERIFLGYGDDSVAQLGGAHVACEWTSNLLTKILQRPRLASYLEQSTRYIAYDYAARRLRLPLPPRRALRPAVRARDGRSLLDVHAPARGDVGVGRRAVPARRRRVGCGARARGPREGARSRARPPPRGVALAHGHLRERPDVRAARAAPARASARGGAVYGQMLLEELQKIIPSFVVRVPRPDRGGRWIEFLRERREAADAAAARLGLDAGEPAARRPFGSCARTGPKRSSLPRSSSRPRRSSEDDALRAVDALADGERAALIRELVGNRENRRHRPGRGFETLSYRFEIVSDYGAFRDLQRHRLLTCQWQRLSPDLGADVPHELVARRPRRRLRACARGVARRVRAAARRRARRGGAVRALRSPSASATCSSSTRARRCT